MVQLCMPFNDQLLNNDDKTESSLKKDMSQEGIW